RPHDARAIAAARMEVLGLALPLTLADHVDGRAERGPDVVVVDAGRHHVDQHLVRSDAGRRDHLALPGVVRLAEAILPDATRVHLRRHDAELGAVTEIVEISDGPIVP